MPRYKGYFIDLDGTMYKGKAKIPAAPRFINRLRETGQRLLFVTNNSTKSPEDVATNLTDNHDIKTSADEVYTTAMATADYLNQVADSKHRLVYVVGESGLKDALVGAGFIMTETNPDYVVVGLDYDVTYHKLELAVLNVRSGSTFIGTNADSNLPNERGMVPGAGSLVKLVEYATQTKPIMIGKPERIIMDMALQCSGLKRDEVVMVGDNYNTDVLAGIGAEIDTLMVYSGLSTKTDVAKQSILPTYQVDTLDDWKFE